ncbi:MAG: hypothetical protein HY232_19255 [Acidobacteria bacterium]|nr:hypothetical protein [Acidobacteriota bacterium]
MNDSNEFPEFRSVGGLLVLDRVSWATRLASYPSRIIRPPAVPLKLEVIIRRYRGIEGEPWPPRKDISSLPPYICEGLANPANYPDVRVYIELCSQEFLSSDLIYCDFLISNEPDIPDYLRTDFSFCGYDCGFYLSEFGHYSALFHEVIFGVNEKLRKFGELLNEHLLLDSRNAVEDLTDLRKRLLDQGVDLEVDDEIHPIGIYGVIK